METLFEKEERRKYKAAFVFSAVAMLMPDSFPHPMQHGGKVAIYLEAAAVVVVLVLLGQVLELRALVERAAPVMVPEVSLSAPSGLVATRCSGRS